MRVSFLKAIFKDKEFMNIFNKDQNIKEILNKTKELEKVCLFRMMELNLKVNLRMIYLMEKVKSLIKIMMNIMVNFLKENDMGQVSISFLVELIIRVNGVVIKELVLEL